MYYDILQALEKPPLYTKTKGEFWNDSYISQQMLKAHLDPEFEGASRKLEFIESSASRIKELVPPAEFSSLLDVGCGPGLYTERFSRQGYRVTGIDFSRRSIEYARRSAAGQGLDIAYFCQDYLEMSFREPFDFATMIYCDYGALSDVDRKGLMNRIYRQLKPGGKFLFDVFSVVTYDSFQEAQTWEVCPQGGFWREEGYVALCGQYRYPNLVTLKQTTVLSDRGMMTYQLWDTCFTRESLRKEAEESGFKVCGIFGDIAGMPYREDSPTLAVLLEK